MYSAAVPTTVCSFYYGKCCGIFQVQFSKKHMKM